ncbi:MAG TPA: biotin/lipoyl-binding protein [Bacteroidetes bacterium]|nr:biotin/lipoyl-binding protein [Candidatus Limimorpha avicola]
MKKFKFTLNGKEYAVEVKKYEGENAEVVVDGNEYKVKVQREEEPVQTFKAAPRPKAGTAPKVETKAKATPSETTPGGFRACAPLPGTIMQIFVKEGDVVKRGQKLLMYEAMKMENNFLAEVDGTIKEIKVRVGDNIIQGALLFVIG